MTSRRDRQLTQLGITQWRLRRPAVLQGEIALRIPEHIRLVMVADKPPTLTDPLIQDVLRALTLTEANVLPLTPDRAALLPEGSRCNSWRLGVESPLTLPGVQLSSPGFDELLHNAAARIALWRQICEHEQDLFP